MTAEVTGPASAGPDDPFTATLTRKQWKEIHNLVELGCEQSDNYDAEYYEPAHRLANALGGELWR